MRFRLVWVIAGLLPCLVGAQQPDYYSFGARMAFAQALLQNKDYTSARLELQSTLRESLSPFRRDTALFLLSKVYYQTDSLTAMFRTLGRIGPAPDVGERAAVLRGAGFLSGIDFSGESITNMERKLRAPAQVIQAGRMLSERRFGAFDSLAGADLDDVDLRQAMRNLDLARRDYLGAWRPSPVASGVLNFLFPGAGKAYMGDWAGVFQNMLGAAILGVQVWEGYHRHSDLQMYGFAGLWMGLHSFNAYGTYFQAKHERMRLERRLDAQVRVELAIPLRLLLAD